MVSLPAPDHDAGDVIIDSRARKRSKELHERAVVAGRFRRFGVERRLLVELVLIVAWYNQTVRVVEPLEIDLEDNYKDVRL